MVAASGSSSGLPPKGSAGANVEPSTTGGDGDGAAAERGRNGVDLTRSNEASSSSWTVAQHLDFILGRFIMSMDDACT